MHTHIYFNHMEFSHHFIVYLKERETILTSAWPHPGRWFGPGVWSCSGRGCRCFLSLSLSAAVHSCWSDSTLRCPSYDCKHKQTYMTATVTEATHKSATVIDSFHKTVILIEATRINMIITRNNTDISGVSQITNIINITKKFSK